VNVFAAGHGDAVVESGVMVSTRRLDDVRIDPGARLATVGGGTQWRDVVAAAAEHGLAPITGASGVVGVVGFLLGGGVGPLARSHGFGSDHLLGATVVTGGGEIVDTDDHPDLLWALRGGRAGLGVVTEARVGLVELSTLYAGALFFDTPHIEQAFRAYVDWTAGTDPRITTSAAIVRFPPFDMVPEPLRGRRLLSVRFAYPGPTAEGERLAAPLRAFAPVHLDGLGELPAAEIARIHNDPTEPAPAWVSGSMLAAVDQDFANALGRRRGVAVHLGRDPPARRGDHARRARGLRGGRARRRLHARRGRGRPVDVRRRAGGARRAEVRGRAVALPTHHGELHRRAAVRGDLAERLARRYVPAAGRGPAPVRPGGRVPHAVLTWWHL